MGNAGSIEDSCGTMKSPCQSLQLGINKCKKNGKVVVQGRHYVSTGIDITKSVSIIGEHGATIQGHDDYFKQVFTITKSLTFSLYDVSFEDVSIMYILSPAKVRIENCSLTNSKVPKPIQRHLNNLEKKAGEAQRPSFIKYFPYPIIKLTSTIDLTILNSTFIGWKSVPVIATSEKSQSNVIVQGCTFMNNVAIDLSGTKNLQLALHNNTFIRSSAQISGKVKHLFITACSFKKWFSDVKNVVEISGEVQSLSIIKCSFDNITGGAISFQGKVKSSSAVISDSIFRNLKRERELVQEERLSKIGNIVLGYSASIIISNCLFADNENNIDGGDIKITHTSNIIIQDSSIMRSKATGSTSKGGSINVELVQKLTIANCSFTNISAGYAGGAIWFSNKRNRRYEDAATPTEISLQNCTFIGNRAVSSGGAVNANISNGNMNVQSCTFDSNEATQGGGILVRHGAHSYTTIEHTIFSNNHATKGGAVRVNKEREFSKQTEEQVSYSVVIRESTFTNNSAETSGQSIFNNDNMKLKKVSITSFERYVAPHLQSDTGHIEIFNTSVELFRLNSDTLPGKSKAIELNSAEVRIWDGFKLTCPTNFKIDQLKNISNIVEVFSKFLTDGPPSRLTRFTDLNLDCVSCPSSSYTLRFGQYYIPYLLCTDEWKLSNTLKITIAEARSHTQPITIQNPECTLCPTGKINFFE